MRRLISASLVALGLPLALGGCLGDGESEAEGKRVFKRAKCGNCHTLADAGAKGAIGPSLDALDLDVKGVIRQITHGGRGMPAFKDRLTSAEIIELATYINSVAGKQPPRFEPDDTVLTDCFAELPCYEQAFGNLAYEKGPEVALARFDREIRGRSTISIVVTNQCHQVGHAIGAAALARFDGSIGRAFAAGSETCGSGYYHGILEQGLAGTEPNELREKAKDLCSERLVRVDGYLSYQCLHGLGHGLMLHTRYDLPFALEACEQLASPSDQGACTGGAFMENFISLDKARSRWLKASDLLYPCNKIAERRKYFCYFFVTMRVVPQVQNDLRRAAGVCRRAERDWVGVCFRSFGREALAHSGYNGERARRACRLAGKAESDCIYSVALEYVFADRKLNRGAKFCGREPVATRGSCFGGLGAGVGLLHRDPQRRQSACRSVTSDYASNCIENAAVPVSGPIPTAS